MALYGTFATVRAQAAKTNGFAQAFGYVDEVLRPGSAAGKRVRAVEVGTSQRIELGHGVFAMEQAYHTKARSEGFFESHRSYIDVQVIVDGEELMELADVSRMTVKQPYNAERDFIMYEDFRDASWLRAIPGDTAIFYPVDVHMPSLRLRAEPSLVHKVVVKVPVN